MKLAGLLFVCSLLAIGWACPDGATCCNDVENLCDVPVSDVLFGMVHNAMSSPSHGFYIFANHMNDPIVEALDDGYRGLALDLCNCNGEMRFCHGGSQTGCGVGRRDPVDTFELINNWVDDNPDNVVMIWLQINEAAGGPISLTDVQEIVSKVPVGASGRSFLDRMYRRDRDDSREWPSLGELIETQQQILFFYQGGPDGSEEHPQGIHYFYEYGYSTDWSYASVSELTNTVLDGCPIQRKSSNRNDFFMLNAFVTSKVFGFQISPSQKAAEEINTATFLEPLLEVCYNNLGTSANIVAVDFWDSGDLSSFVNNHNSKLAQFSPPIPSPTLRSTIPPSPSPTRRQNMQLISVSNRKHALNGMSRMRDVEFGG